jgi:hypothetical protein
MYTIAFVENLLLAAFEMVKILIEALSTARHYTVLN